MSNRSQQNSTGLTLRPVQAKVIAAIAQGRTVSAAARAAGIDRSTFYLWKANDPQFAAALFQAQVAYVDDLNALVRDLAPQAIAAIREIITDSDAPAAIRLKASKEVLAAAGALSPPRAVGNADVEECELGVEHHRLRRAEGQLTLEEQRRYLLLKNARLEGRKRIPNESAP